MQSIKLTNHYSVRNWVRLRDQVSEKLAGAYIRSQQWCETHPLTLLFLLGLVVLIDASIEPAEAYDGKKFKTICKNATDLAKGQFGAMLTAIAGIGAIVSSAMGGFKMAWACLVVSVGSFVLKGYITLFFNDCG